MPLGIELAAAWSRAMPCQQIAGQIRRDLDFLATSLRNVPARHRSLRAVFERSWTLLSDAEQGVLMKLSVFRGGIDLEAAEHVADASPLALLALVDKSLIRLAASGRYELHELLRQFAADKLVESNGLAETRLRHLGYFLRLAEMLERRLFGPPYVSCLSRLEIEHDNFRAALDWAERAGSTELGLRLAAALGLFWYRRGYWMEGCEWLRKFLTDNNQVPLEIRAKALPHLLDLTFLLSDRRQLAILWPLALTVVREVRDPWVVAWLLCAMGGNGYEWERSRTYLEEALTLFRALDDKQGICGALWRLGQNHFQRGEFATADEFLQEGIKLAREVDDKSVLSFLLMMRGCKNWYQGMYDQAIERLYEESLALFRELHEPFSMMVVMCQLGKIAHVRGEDDQAVECFEQGLRLGQQIGTKGMSVFCLMNLAEILCQRGEPKRGARLIGAVGDLVPVFFAQPSLTDRDGRLDFERAVTVARTQLGEAEFRAAYGEGQIMSLDQAIADALTNPSQVETE
jgi:tetratricopeptide (TPR) repeat protein